MDSTHTTTREQLDAALAARAERISSHYNRPDGRAAVRGWWVKTPSWYLGEVTVLTPGRVLRFSTSTPMAADGLAGYATDDYLARHAAKFQPRVERYG